MGIERENKGSGKVGSWIERENEGSGKVRSGRVGR